MKKHRISINPEHDRYYRRNWLELEAGGSDSWLYVARDCAVYVFILVCDCGRDAEQRYCASVDVVDLAAASPETIASALQCCGVDASELDPSTESGRLWLAECLHSDGAKSPMWEDTRGMVRDPSGVLGENYMAFRSLRKEAWEVAKDLLSDADYRDHELDSRIVNAIGQTAREYAGGTASLWDSLRRIQSDPNATPEQALILRLYQSAETTLGAGPVPRDLLSEDSDPSVR